MLFALLLAALVGFELLRDFTPAKLSVGFVMLAWLPLLVVHEAGHALVARWVGWSVREMVIGFGPEVARFSVGGVRVVLRLVPVEGYVIPVPDSPRGARAKNALVYFGGPGAEIAVILVLGFALGWDVLLTRSESVPIIALQSLGVSAALGVFMTLVPHASAGAASDGLGILLSASLPDEHFEYRMALPASAEAVRMLDLDRPDDALEAIDAGLARLPDHPLLLATRARCLAASGDTADARALLEQLRQREQLPEIYEAERLHAAACLVLESPDSTETADAVEACRAALQLTPGDPAIMLTLGALLLSTQQPREALPPLMAAYKATRDPALEDRCLAYLAAVHRALGSLDDARLFAVTLRARSNSPRLLDLVRDC